MQEDPAHRVPDDEIDLSRLGRRIWLIISYPFRLLGRHPVTTICFVAAAVLLAVISKYTIPKSYTASFVVRPVDRAERFHHHMLGDLRRMLKQKDIGALSAALQLDSLQAAKVYAIEGFYPAMSHRDSVNYSVITISSADPELLVTIQDGILQYMENNPYFSKIWKLNKSQVELQKKHAALDLSRIDSLKSAQLQSYRRGGTGGSVLISELIDPSKIYAMGNERLNKMTALMAQEQFLDNFQLVKPVVPPRIHSFPPRILVMCLYLVPLSLLICFVILAAFDIRRRMKRS